MAIDPKDLPDLLDETPMEVSHPLEVEFHHLIIENHRLILEGISRIEKEELVGLDDEDEIRYQQRYFDDLRIAAHNLALVAVVTRLDHWAKRHCENLKLKPQKPKGKKLKAPLVQKLEMLNGKLGTAVPLLFFEDLITARDSVIHGDSQAEWIDHRNEKRKIAEKYGSWRLELTEEQLAEAVANTLKQLMWYDEQWYKLKHP
jgi:hypothetical protein